MFLRGANWQLPFAYSLTNALSQVFLYLWWLKNIIANVGEGKNSSSTLLGLVPEPSESNWENTRKNHMLIYSYNSQTLKGAQWCVVHGEG